VEFAPEDERWRLLLLLASHPLDIPHTQHYPEIHLRHNRSGKRKRARAGEMTCKSPSLSRIAKVALVSAPLLTIMRIMKCHYSNILSLVLAFLISPTHIAAAAAAIVLMGWLSFFFVVMTWDEKLREKNSLLGRL
jgi:hypothetical protein